jgi:Holliday junction resolvase RusA-like endonuclease
MIAEFFVHMTPVPKGRARVTKVGHSFTPKKTATAETLVQQVVGSQWRNPPLDCALNVLIWVFVLRPKTKASAIKFPVPTGRPDWDNYGKLVCDALNGILWADDSRIVTGSVRKRYCNDDFPCPGFLIQAAEAEPTYPTMPK